MKKITQFLRNTFILSLISILGFTSCVSSNETKEKNGFTTLSMEDGIALLEKSEDFVLVDVRRPAEYDGGHIPGAILLTNEEMTKESVEAALPNKDQLIFIYCRSGHRSKIASQKLVDWGYTNIVNIGGIMFYKGEIER